ncbi:MAG: MFS transporter [Undibacterium umbellatum]|uniref:MFS transporter n=1 Tax=Undibacterium TaxID=401469 RepID=UPI002731D4EA|nr:MFS transporter [Undibacterium sp.]MDP1979465.1 MFS transporter [Undibacterium sp.]
MRQTIFITVLGHFGAAFAALCMPPFYAHILQQNFSSQTLVMAGWYFTLPTLAAAISNPLWGKLADRIGIRASLIRAHWGLCLSFIVTGMARTPWEFAFGLTLQGLLGGTFAASNAFLASFLPGKRLATLLSVMQGSARTALFAGPAIIGLFSDGQNLLHIFFYLAVFPGLAGLILYLLPAKTGTLSEHSVTGSTGQVPAQAGTLSASSLYRYQALFTLGTVLTYPYFVIDLAQRLDMSAAWAGALFGLPHALFLVLAWPIGRHVNFSNAQTALARFSALTCAGLLLQLLANDLPVLATGRILMGVGMTGAYLAINALAASTTRQASAGQHFGKLEGANKWGAVMAGILASGLATSLSYTAPIWLACALLAGLSIFIESKRL